jgi:hypothetical protein
VGAALPLLERTNPAWSDALRTLHDAAIVPIFGGPKTHLQEIEWQEVQRRFAAYEAWRRRLVYAALILIGVALGAARHFHLWPF